MKSKHFNNYLIKALIVICSPVLIILFGIVCLAITLFADRDYDDF